MKKVTKNLHNQCSVQVVCAKVYYCQDPRLFADYVDENKWKLKAPTFTAHVQNLFKLKTA